MTSLRHAFALAGLLLCAWTGCAHAAGSSDGAIGQGTTPQALRFQHANANARLERDRTRLTTTGPDVVASAFVPTPIAGRAYIEAEIFHGGRHAAGVSLWGESPERLRDDAHPGRSYGAAGASAQVVSAWAMVAYANYGLPGDTKLEMAALSGAPGQRVVVQVAVDAGARAVWMRLAGTRGWAGGGDPATGARPTLVLDGDGPILVGGNVSDPASHLELLAPSRHWGAAPAGFMPFG